VEDQTCLSAKLTSCLDEFGWVGDKPGCRTFISGMVRVEGGNEDCQHATNRTRYIDIRFNCSSSPTSDSSLLKWEITETKAVECSIEESKRDAKK